MITEEIVFAMDDMIGLCTDEGQKKGMTALREMLCDWDESQWDSMDESQRKNWLSGYLDSGNVGAATENDWMQYGFYIVNGIKVDLRDYVQDEKLIRQLMDDLSFASDVSFGFEKEFSWADDDVTGDEVLETVIFAEIEKRTGKTSEEIVEG